jgi:hypothetical protein
MLLNFHDIGQTGITILSQELGNSVKTNSNGEVKKTYLAHKISCVFRHQWAFDDLNNDRFVVFDMFRRVTGPGRTMRRNSIGFECLLKPCIRNET